MQLPATLQEGIRVVSPPSTWSTSMPPIILVKPVHGDVDPIFPNAYDMYVRPTFPHIS